MLVRLAPKAKLMDKTGPRLISTLRVQMGKRTHSAMTAAQINTAYSYLEARDDVGIVVPLGVGITGSDVSPGDTTSLVQNLKTHADSMSAQGKYRIGVVGLETSATRTHSTLAQSMASKRLVIGYPNILNWYNGYTNTTMELGGVYLAAALGGMLSARMPQEPLTKKIVRSFPSIPARVFSTMTKTAKDDMSNAGVCVVEQRGDAADRQWAPVGIEIAGGTVPRSSFPRQ